MAMRELDPRTSNAAFVGAKLRRYRVRASLTQAELANLTSWSASAIAMIERGQRPAPTQLLEAADDVLKADGEIEELGALLAAERYPANFRPWVAVEREAVDLVAWELSVFPGLLQTEGYARAVIDAGQPRATEQEKRDLVHGRMDRGKLLAGDDAPSYLAIIDSTVLERPIGGAAVMAEQCDALITACESKSAHVQVLPSEVGAHPGLAGGAFAVATLRDDTRAALLDNAGEGQVTTHPADLDTVGALLNAIRLEALPERASLVRISEMMEKWKGLI